MLSVLMRFCEVRKRGEEGLSKSLTSLASVFSVKQEVRSTALEKVKGRLQGW